MAIELLAIALCSLPGFKGITRYGKDQKVSLYTDDLLLFISKPTESVPHILKTLECFGNISCYKLNLDKSEVFPINEATGTSLLSTLPFKVSKKGFTYLGVAITDKFNKLFKSNFETLFTCIKEDLHRWSSLPLSLAGRINSVKMKVLPKFLYLFQCIPTFISKIFFHKLDTEVLEFIWNKRVPQLHKTVLQKPKRDGGMALPNFLYYYWAANNQPVLHWMRADNDSPAWCLMESSFCTPASLSALITSSPVSVKLKTGNNILVKSTLRIWSQFYKHVGAQTPPLCILLCKNPVFLPSMQDNAFELWFQIGVCTVRNLFVDGVFASFQQLAEKFHLPISHLFRHLQVRDFYRKMYRDFQHTPADAPIDKILKAPMVMKG